MSSSNSVNISGAASAPEFAQGRTLAQRAVSPEAPSVIPGTGPLTSNMPKQSQGTITADGVSGIGQNFQMQQGGKKFQDVPTGDQDHGSQGTPTGYPGAHVVGKDGTAVPVRTDVTGKQLVYIHGMEMPLPAAIASGFVSDGTIMSGDIEAQVNQAQEAEGVEGEFDAGQYASDLNAVGTMMGEDNTKAVLTAVINGDDIELAGATPEQLAQIGQAMHGAGDYVENQGAVELQARGIAPAQQGDFAEWVLTQDGGDQLFVRAAMGDWNWMDAAIRQWRAI